MAAAPEQSSIDWPRCRASGCIGIELDGTGRCWAHAPGDAVHRALERLAEGGTLDARGVRFTAARLREVLAAAAPEDGAGRARLLRADLRSCRFAPDTSFAGVHFAGETRFDGARFEGDANFEDARFAGEAWFEGTVVAGEGRFSRAAFAATTWFKATSFGASGWFDDVSFEAGASFHEATFARDAQMHGARFRADLTATAATVGRDAIFGEAVFEGGTALAGLRVGGLATFTKAVFTTARQLGPLAAGRRVELDGTEWQARARIQAVTPSVSCRRARFLDGVQLQARRGAAPPAEIDLEEADLSAPSIVGHGRPFPDLGAEAESAGAGRTDEHEQERLPQLVSVCRADVAGLTVSQVDLGRCRFDGAHNLDRLRTDAVRFAALPESRWRTGREVIAEEQHWRARRAVGRRSRSAWEQAIAGGSDGELPKALRADQIAALYRALRRGRESLKDEPGAADLYYGEMEMRRLATSRRHRPGSGRLGVAAAGEHLILTLYWLVSGYGLRAWRALAGLAALVVLAGLALVAWGLHDPPPAGDRVSAAEALLTSARAATAVLAGPDDRLTTFGEWVQIGLRLLGPTLLGLAVLSIRGRVRR